MATVLVVDDRSINRKFLAALLGFAGHAVVEAADGNEALASAQHRRPDLIITDLIMPVMDGVELVKRLRADTATADIPVVFYTATYRVHEARALARSCGVHHVLAKPSSGRMILDMVAGVLGATPSPRGLAELAAADLEGAAPPHLRDLVGLQRRLHEALDTDDVPGIDSRTPTKVHALSLRLAALLELSLTIGPERDPHRLLELFCRAAQDIIGCRYAGAIVVDPELGAIIDYAGSGLADAERDDLARLDLSAGFMADVLRSADPICLLMLNGDATRGGLPVSHPPIETLLGARLRSASETRGLMYFADKVSGAAFDEDDEQFATTLAAQLALYYDNLTSFESLRRHAGELHVEVVERIRVETALLESNRRFTDLLANVDLIAATLDVDGRVTYCNQYLLALTGWSSAEVVGKCWFDVFTPIERVEDARAVVRALMRGERSAAHHESEILTRAGARRCIRWNSTTLRSGSGAVIGGATIGEDITERREQERKVAALSRTRAVIGGISSAMARSGTREELLQEACRVVVTDGVFAQAWAGVVDPDTLEGSVVAWFGGELDTIRFDVRADAPDIVRPACRAVRELQPVVVNDIASDPCMAAVRESLLRRGYRSTAAFPLIIERRAAAVLVLFATEVGFFQREEIELLGWMVADLVFALERIQNKEQLKYLAYFDALTALPNATLFEDRLRQFVEAARQDHGKVCVVVLDLERFTQINDTLGRKIGDDLLKAVAARFTQLLVEPCTLGRIGADTFAAASPRDGGRIATALRQQMFDALLQPFAIDGREVRLAAQAGIAFFPADGADGNSVFKNAESALKHAKSAGQRFEYFSAEMNARIAERALLEQQLRVAVEKSQFVLRYQARVDMISGKIVGAEALIRWQHPDRGLLLPDLFIGLAEETGVIVAIGAWMIDAVCAKQAAWLKSGVGIVPIAVNLSSLQFEQGDLLKTVHDALAAHDIEARHLDLELTETAVMVDPAAADSVLRALHELGVGLALDDFGTGFSSLAHLKRFAFDAVKIDRSFVAEITHNPDDAAIAAAIVAMAHRLNLKVVAEGVETQGQFNLLRALGCDDMQGFLFSPAVTADEFEIQLRNGKCLVPPVPAQADVRTLLVVDDEPGVRSALNRVLRRDGYRILNAAGGVEGLDLLALNPVQVIIADQRMPGMSGTQFLDTVKQLYPDTMRIVLSGYTDLAVVTDSVNRGAVFKFLTKPWDDDLLREQVRDAFRRYRPEVRA